MAISIGNVFALILAPVLAFWLVLIVSTVLLKMMTFYKKSNVKHDKSEQGFNDEIRSRILSK